MKAEKLIQNIIDQIKEAQLKLGFARETMRLYFPVDSINAIMENNYSDSKELLNALEQDEKLKNSVLGNITFSGHDGRIEVRIPPEGVVYVKTNVYDPLFLKKLLQLFENNHHLTIEEICECFASVDVHYRCSKMKPGSDFDYVLYFENKQIDPYYYCVKMEMGHTIYHRFVRADYEKL